MEERAPTYTMNYCPSLKLLSRTEPATIRWSRTRKFTNLEHGMKPEDGARVCRVGNQRHIHLGIDTQVLSRQQVT